MKTICVYCGSSSDVDDIYKQVARDFGRLMAEEGITLVYGGGHVGLMGIIADAVLQGGGEVIGIIPEFITAREISHDHLTELHVVKTMHERKMLMAERSDAFVVLPGGFGTMDEFFEILTWRQLQIHDKPIVLLNTEGYWSGLIELLDNIIAKGFARPAHKENFKVVTQTEEVLPALREFGAFTKGLNWDKI